MPVTSTVKRATRGILPSLRAFSLLMRVVHLTWLVHKNAVQHSKLYTVAHPNVVGDVLLRLLTPPLPPQPRSSLPESDVSFVSSFVNDDDVDDGGRLACNGQRIAPDSLHSTVR